MLPSLLSKAGPLPVVHPENGTIFQAGVIYVAPPDRHMLVQKNSVRLSHGPHENLTRPAIDPLFRSAAIAHGPAVVGVVLTGQLNDGTSGLLAVKDRGGFTIVQDPSEAVAPSMPRSAIRHMKVDKICGLEEMARLLVVLAYDDPLSALGSLQELMEIENRIAEGIFSVEDWWRLEKMSTPSGLNCPNCGSALYEVNDDRVLRFRCRSGHAYSAEALLCGQAEARETLLSSLFGSLIEEATLAKRMQKMGVFGDDPQLAGSLESRAESLGREASQVCEWLHAMTNLVEPEPAAGKPSELAHAG
jgi:two-component system chemotaxis response regulator CheB